MILKRPIGEKGQVVVPKYIRELLKLRKGENVVFEQRDQEVIIKSEQDPEEFLREFFSIARDKKKKDLTLEDLRRMEEESYDLP